MNRVAADLSWYQKLQRRLALRALRHNVWHEYQDGLCCEVEFKDGDLRYRHGEWCDCSTATQHREVAHRRRVDAGGYVPVTELGPPPQGEPALAPAYNRQGVAMRITHTYALLEVSPGAYEEIAGKLRAAGYDHAFDEGAIDMHGLALTKSVPERDGPAPAPAPGSDRYDPYLYDTR